MHNDLMEHVKYMQQVLSAIRTQAMEVAQYIKTTDPLELQWRAIVQGYPGIMGSPLFPDKDRAQQVLNRLVPELLKLADDRKSFKEQYLAFYIGVGKYTQEQMSVMESLKRDSNHDQIAQFKFNTIRQLSSYQVTMQNYYSQHQLLKNRMAEINAEMAPLVKG